MDGHSFSFTMALTASSHFTLFCDYKFFFIFIGSMFSAWDFFLSLFCLPGLGEWPGAGERAQGATLSEGQKYIAKIPMVCVAML